MRLTPPHLLRLFAGLTALLLIASPSAAMAYTGPGLGLGAIGVAFGIIGSLLLGLVSIVWYPVKRLVRRMRK